MKIPMHIEIDDDDNHVCGMSCPFLKEMMDLNDGISNYACKLENMNLYKRERFKPLRCHACFNKYQEGT